MFKRIKILHLLFPLILLLTGVGVSAQDEGEDLRFFLPFIPNIQFSPMYAAIANGYFSEVGLNVTLEYGDENVAVDLIAADELKFGMISGEQVILARAGGRPVVYVYEWYQQYPIGLVVTDTSEIKSLDDLAGQRIGIPGLFGASYSGIIALLGAQGLTESDVTLEAIGFNAPDVVCTGAIQAAVVYVNNEPLQIQQRADAGECGDVTSVTVYPVAADIDIVSNGIVTNEATITDNPDLVSAVTHAYDQGLRDTINNPAATYLLSVDYVEGLPMIDELQAALEAAAAAQTEFLATAPDREAIAQSRADLLTTLEESFAPDVLLQFRVLLATIDLWDAETLGVTDSESWQTAADILITIGALDEVDDLEAGYTNAFVPEAE